MKIKLFLALIFASTFVQSQNIITTVVGNGTSGYTGDGGPASACELAVPRGIIFDSNGNMFISDNNNNCIRKVSPSGIITTIAGNGTLGYSGDGGPATTAQLNYPCGIALDAAANLYIADTDNNRIRKVDVNGIITTVTGTGVSGFSGDGGLAISAQVHRPDGISFDAFGNLFIADVSNHSIRKVNTAGVISTVVGNGTFGFAGDGGPADSALLHFPTSVTFDAIGNMYISDQYNHRIRKVDLSGIITTVAGNGTGAFSGNGGVATAAALYYPTFAIVDAVGNLYISDTFNDRVRVVNTSGIINAFAGTGVIGFGGDGGPAINAKLNAPFGSALDAANNLYICDETNNRIRKVTFAAGIEQMEDISGGMLIYPNPATEKINIESYNKDIKNICIKDLLGNIIFQTLQNTIDVSNFANGAYFLTVTADKEIATRKFIVNK